MDKLNKILILGSTGLVGSNLYEKYTNISSFSQRQTNKQTKIVLFIKWEEEMMMMMKARGETHGAEFQLFFVQN